MFGEDCGFISRDNDNLSEAHKAMVDKKVQEILKESKERVANLLQKHENDVINVAINLYKYDYLNKEEIDKIVKGEKLDKKNVREFDPKIDNHIIKF